MRTETNAPYPNRIQLFCAPYQGPFTRVVNAVPVPFDPLTEIQSFVDGTTLPITIASFDPNNNRYLMYAAAPFNVQGVVQSVYHFSAPEVYDSSSPPQVIPGFGLIATYSTEGDQDLTPSIGITAVPNFALPNTLVDLYWTSFNVENVRITTTIPGSPPFIFDTGFLSTVGSGIYPVVEGFPASVVLTIEAYDEVFNPIIVNSVPLTATTTVLTSVPLLTLIAVPNPTTASTPVDLDWTSFLVENVRITSPSTYFAGVDFAGNIGYVYTANDFSWSNDPTISVEFWFQTTTTAGGFLVSVAPEQMPSSDESLTLLGIYMETSGNIDVGWNNGSANQFSTATPLAYNDGSPHQCVVTISSGATNIYMDGANVVTSSLAIGGGSQTGWWRIAEGLMTSGYPTISPTIDSYLSHVSVWQTTAITSGQVSAHYTAL